MSTKSFPSAVAIIAVIAALLAAPASSLKSGICRPPTPVISLLGQPTFGCECSSFVWNNKGVNVGRCSSVDLDGRPMCYLHQPNNCPDAQESLVFPKMEISKIGCLKSPSIEDAIFGRLKELLREPLQNPGGSREAQMASAVDGLLWRTGGEDGEPRTDADGVDEDGAQKMGATDREGNLLLPLNPRALCRGKLCPNSTSRRIKNALLMGAQRHPEDIREAQAAERLAMMVEDNEAVIGGGLEIMMPASVGDDGAELF